MKATALAALTVAAALLVAMPASGDARYKGTVGPGFTIKMASKPKKAGKVKIVVADKSSVHNFHLRGRE